MFANILEQNNIKVFNRDICKMLIYAFNRCPSMSKWRLKLRKPYYILNKNSWSHSFSGLPEFATKVNNYGTIRFLIYTIHRNVDFIGGSLRFMAARESTKGIIHKVFWSGEGEQQVGHGYILVQHTWAELRAIWACMQSGIKIKTKQIVVSISVTKTEIKIPWILITKQIHSLI